MAEAEQRATGGYLTPGAFYRVGEIGCSLPPIDPSHLESAMSDLRISFQEAGRSIATFLNGLATSFDHVHVHYCREHGRKCLEKGAGWHTPRNNPRMRYLHSHYRQRVLARHRRNR